MGNGCLKPKPRTGEIYIDCINEIYQQVKLIDQNTIKQFFVQFFSRNSHDLYSLIKQKIQKKGWLRKLMDYLTSHRSSISEAALHNFRLMAQSKGIQYKIAGLIIIDYIVNAVLRQSGLEIGEKIGMLVLNMMMKQKDINAESIYQQSQNKRQYFPNNPTNISKQNNVIHTAASLQNIQPPRDQSSLYKVFSSKPQHLITNHTSSSNNNNESLINPNYNQSNSLMLRQIYNAKFSNIYYNMMHSIISMNDELYLHCVKSIITYTKYNGLKNIQQQKILDILTILLEHVQTGEEVTFSLRAYQLLVQKLRDSFLQNQIKHLKVFLKIWEESFVNTNDQQNQFIQTNLQNRFLLQSILQKMITLTIGSMYVNRIYEQIIYFYDQHRFQKMIPFQQMLISITKKNDLKNQFFRGLYCYLLSYLAVCKPITQIQTSKSIASTKQITNDSTVYTNKWAYINTNKTYQSFLSDYQNILDLKVKMSVIDTLKRWTRQYQFIQINQIIKYNSALLLNTFLFNIHEAHISQNLSHSMIRKIPSQQKSFSHYLASQFCTSFCSNAELQQRIALVNFLHDHIKAPDVQQSQKMLYIDMIYQLIYEQWIESQKILQFCQVDASYNVSINIEILSQANVLVNKFTQKMLYKQIDQIAYFLFSIFECISKVSVCYNEFINFLNNAIKLIQTIERSKGSLIVLAFTQRMAKAINNQMDKQNFFMCWDLILNCAYILHGSPRNYKRQKSKKQLNEIYIKLTVNQQLKTNVNKLSIQQFDQKIQKILVNAFGDLTQDQQQQNLLRIQLPQSTNFQAPNSYTYNQKTYQLASIAFRDMFSRGISIVKGGFMNKNQQDEGMHAPNTNNGFVRTNSIIGEQDIGYEEKSIADVMDMINI